MNSNSSAPSASSAPENRNEMLVAETAGELSTEEVAIIFGFLTCEDIMRLRRVCTTWRDAAKKTPVPLTDFLLVNDVRSYNAMRVMSTALPTFQKIVLRRPLGEELDEEWAAQTADSITHEIEHKYNDEQDPYERLAQRTADWSTLDIDIISRFRKLRILQIYNAPLNGIYPVLFNFPHLQKLRIWHCTYLKWDLEMLEGLPSLKEFYFVNNPRLSGNISSLRVLKDTLEKMEITDCRLVEGNFMDLADFPRLKKLDLSDTALTGDIRDIRGHDFPAVVSLSLPKGVHGGIEYKFQNASDVHSFMHAIHRILQRTPSLFHRHRLLPRAFDWTLSKDSPDWYDRGSGNPPPSFDLQLIQAGSRRGWSWCTWYGDHSCEINWLDPEPDSESSDYEAYVEELQRIERRINFYRGYHEPPTEAEYRRLCEELRERF